jgi:hypothetical protein
VFLGIVTLTSNNPFGMVSIAFALPCIWGAVCLIASDKRNYPVARQRFEQELPRWEQAMARWSALFYCPRCDNAYDPQTGEAAPAAAMCSLL